jgi:hypothetical protein
VAFEELVSGLRKTEQQLVKQLEGVRKAISSLEFGSAVSPALGGRPVRRRRRRLSAKARAAISRAQKLRWAKHRAEARKS